MKRCDECGKLCKRRVNNGFYGMMVCRKCWNRHRKTYWYFRPATKRKG